jgi:AraC family transcriptional regulator
MESRNFILKGSASQYYWKGPGLCSIKTFSGGSAFYNIGKGSFRVDDSSFLVLNDATDYSIEISGKQVVDSYCLFFDRGLLAEASLGLASSAEFQLDNSGYYGNGNSTAFFERTYPLPELGFDTTDFQLKHSFWAGDRMWLEQKFFGILQHLGQLDSQNARARDRLIAARSTTRAELYRRILLAREFIHANPHRVLSLREIARTSHLSVNHLLRCFTASFGMTPHAYSTLVKLDHAKRLLANPDWSVMEIITELGFSSIASFSLLFKRHCGHSPANYRKLKFGDIR